jgi:hypothetical protein
VVNIGFFGSVKHTGRMSQAGTLWYLDGSYLVPSKKR